MKSRIFVLLLIVLSLNLTAAENKASQQIPPAVTPVEKYTPPQLSTPDSWTMVVVPDTQAYVARRRNQGALDLMFTWIAENVDRMKIQQVVHLGDMVDVSQQLVTGKDGTYQSGAEQWEAISKVFERLDNVVPYVLTTGNHDYGWRSAENRSCNLDKFFPTGRNDKWKNVLVGMGQNAFGQLTLENAAYEFTTPNGQKILIVSVNFAPTDENLAWAKSVFSNKKYKNHFGILVTHSYLRSLRHKGRLEKKGYELNKQGGNEGAKIFQKLVKNTPNIRMVLCGHISAVDNWNGCVNYEVSTNDAGKKVHEILFDPQALGGGWGGNGGDGWLRLMEFDKDMKHVKVKTFSPVFAYSPSTCNLAWHTAPFNEFEFDID